MQTEAEKKCADQIQLALKENNCALVPKAKKNNSALAKIVDNEIFAAVLSVLDIIYEVEEKK